MGWETIAAVGGCMLGGLGSYFGAKEQADATRDVNAQNIGLSREQMQFQEKMAASAQNFSERMSNTAHIRAVADLRDAGLNPILAAGGPASSPSGVSASGSMPSLSPVPSEITAIMGSAREMLSLYNETTAVNANAAKALADTHRADLDSESKRMTNEVYRETSQRALNLMKTVESGWNSIRSGINSIGNKAGDVLSSPLDWEYITNEEQKWPKDQYYRWELGK